MEDRPMHVEFTHVTAPFSPSSGAPATSFFFDPREARRRISLIENAGFNRLVVDDAGGVLTNMDLASQVSQCGSTLDIALTHWAGVIEPVVAARQIAALDRESNGHLSLRVMAGSYYGAGALGQATTGHVAASQRTDEYLVLLKRLWSNDRPFDHEGAAYSLRNGFVARKGPRGPEVPFRLSGLSGTAFRVAGRHASVFELPFAVPGHVRHIIDRVRTAASEAGRSSKIAFALSLPFDRYGIGGSQLADEGDVEAAIRNGAPERIALALLPYLEAGISEFLIKGLFANKAIEMFAEQLAPIVRNSAARLSGHDMGWMAQAAYSNRGGTLRQSAH
jgi:alkanesulfonate monooxygenase